MTRKDFELIASIIYSLPQVDSERDIAARHFAAILQSAYPRFDTDRFLKACQNG